MKLDLDKLINDGFLIFKKMISNSDVALLVNEINKLNKIYKKKNFEALFKDSPERDMIYQKLQNLNSVRKIVQKVCQKLEKNKFYSKLKFKVPFITNGLILSLPNEKDNLNPLHQDIYNFYSYNFIKIWLPLTKVNKKNGSMLVYKSSNKLGFIEPKYQSKTSTYPEIDNRHTKGFKKIIFELDPGDCVLFNPLILHKSIGNKSKSTRFNIGIDIQDFNINGNVDVIRKMVAIKNQRTLRRNLLRK